MSPVIPTAGAKMKVGVNYAYYLNQYGEYFGNAGMPWEADFEAMVKDFAKVDVKTFRVFMLCNLNQYGTVNWTPLDGDKDTATMWKHEFVPPPSAPASFVNGLLALLKILKANGAQAILSHSDFLAYCTYWTEGGTARETIITNSAFRQKFYRDVLEPMVAASVDYRDQIIAWEPVNEPFWAVERLGSKFGGVATQAQMSTFLSDALTIIGKYGFESTVGHARYKDITAGYPTGTIRQFHYWPSTFNGKDLLPYASTNAIVGEFSPKVGNTSYFGVDDMSQPWPSLDEVDCVTTEIATLERLKLLHKLGYRLALIWPDQDKGPGVSKCSWSVHTGLKKYKEWTP